MNVMSNGKQYTQGGYTNSEKTNMIKNGEERMRAFLAEKFPEVYGTPGETKTEEPKPISNISKIRKAVVTLANQIYKKIKNLSKAFKKAWVVIKSKVISAKVSGVSFGNTQKVLSRLTRYNPQTVKTELVREPENQFDTNAIAVTVSVNNSNRVKIGYIGRELALYLSKLLDKGIALKTAFKGITGGTEQYECYGALIEIQF